jgi:hypothetical protein
VSLDPSRGRPQKPAARDRTRAKSAGAGRQAGWVAEVGRTYPGAVRLEAVLHESGGTRRETMASSPKETASTLTRAAADKRRTGAPCFARNTPDSHGADHVRSDADVSEHDGRRLGSWQHVPFTGSARHGLGPWVQRRTRRQRRDDELHDGWKRSCGARGTTIETSEVGASSIKALPAGEARRVGTSRVPGHASPAPSRAAASRTNPPKLAWLNTTPPSRRIQAARTALGLERPPPSP